MGKIKSLVHTKKLKTNYLAQMAISKSHPPTIKYDKVFDALMILFVAGDQEFVAHYVDNHVALLYIAETLEIVGLQIEDFQLDFLPAHENVARVWRLSDTVEQIKDVGDIIFYVEKRLPKATKKIAQEVAQATKEILGEPAKDFIAALA